MRRLTLLMTVFLATPVLGAQIFSFQSDRVPMVELTGQFHFHTGDNPLWSEPGFDDSSWQLLRSNQDWLDQGHRNYGGMAWYRFTVTFPADHPSLALYVPLIRDSYQIFANGRLIGENGPMPPHAKVIIARRLVFPVPEVAAPRGKPIVFAIRVWHWPQWAAYFGGGPTAALRIGDVQAIREWQTAQNRQVFWNDASGGFLLLLEFLAGLAGLALFAMHRADREYLWFGIYELEWAVRHANWNYRDFHSYWVKAPDLIDKTLILVGTLCFVELVVSIARQRRGLLFWIAIASLAAYAATTSMGALDWFSVSTSNTVTGFAFLPFQFAILALLASGAWRGIRDAQLLLFPTGLLALGNIVERALWITYSSGYTAISPWWDRFNQIATWPFPLSVEDIAEFLTQLALLAILVLRFTRTRRDEERYKNELEAARVVQQVLVPAENPSIPGFAIEAVYKPAGQVGGDFYQIVATPNGGVLMVIGDVSGKGMPAAMTVSLLVGTFRTLAHYTHSPGEILRAMNQRMQARSQGGFTTCLVARVDADGVMTAANAGHLALYLGGNEVALEGGLPLGLDAQSQYTEARLELPPAVRLTLVTDGVVEARNATGELFGFDRAAAISTDAAEEIASAAQAFGQEDDITVLTLTLAPAEVTRA